MLCWGSLGQGGRARGEAVGLQRRRTNAGSTSRPTRSAACPRCRCPGSRRHRRGFGRRSSAPAPPEAPASPRPVIRRALCQSTPLDSLTPRAILAAGPVKLQGADLVVWSYGMRVWEQEELDLARIGLRCCRRQRHGERRHDARSQQPHESCIVSKCMSPIDVTALTPAVLMGPCQYM